jgi:soluble lytic murein transglycosylase
MARGSVGFRSTVFLCLFGLFAGFAAVPRVAAQGPSSLETASLPRAGDVQNPGTSLPTVLDPADAALYREIFDLQETGQWRAADRLIAKLSDDLLMGHVLYQRYMHPTDYRSKYAELKNWMDEYADHPGAATIYALALSRKPGNWKSPRPPASVTYTGPVSASSPAPTETKVEQASRSQRGAIRQVSLRVKTLLRRERPSQALELIESKRYRHVLDAVSFDENLAIIARGFYHAGKDADALAIAERAAKRSGTAVPDAHWWAGLAAWRMERYDDAARHFSAMARVPGQSAWSRTGAAFWAARASLVGHHPEAVTPMLKLAARDPQTFYGLLAMQSLDEQKPFDWNLPALGPIEIELLQHIPAAKRALGLIESGQTVRAESELKRLTGAPSPELSRVLLALVGKANLPDVSVRLGLRMQHRQGETYDAALFPVPQWEPRGGYDLDKALLFAFARQESRFRTDAKSRVGATGLMQLMPATARFIASDEDRFGSRRELTDPELNLALGQKYIQHLLDDPAIGNNLFFVTTAYNAGPGNLRKWQKQVDYKDDPLLFIESIRSRETRNFIERVMTNFWVYRLRMGQDVSSLSAVAAGEWPVYIPLDKAVTQSFKDAN